MLKKKIWTKHRNGARCQSVSCLKDVPAVERHPICERWNILLVAYIFLLTACTASLHPPGTIAPSNGDGLFKSKPSDADIMHEGISCLGSPEQANDYVKARAAFDTLLRTYPESKWRCLSETLIFLIDNMQSCQEKNLLIRKNEEALSGLLQENEKLKKDIRHLHDRLKAETTRLSEENEQLKKDIQLLKNLEIQLEKRDKMLR